MNITSLKLYDNTQTANGIVIYTQTGDPTAAQVDTLTLSGTDGTAVINAGGGVGLLLAFNQDLTTTASDFVTANAVAFGLLGITLTSNNEDLIFTADVVGVPFAHPEIINATEDLTGTNVKTVETGENIIQQTIPFDGLTITARFVENYKNGINGYKYQNKTAIHFKSEVHDFDIELQNIENQTLWSNGTMVGLNQAYKDINSWNVPAGNDSLSKFNGAIIEAGEFTEFDIDGNLIITHPLNTMDVILAITELDYITQQNYQYQATALDKVKVFTAGIITGYFRLIGF
jgi:hypothetical protein